MRKGFILATISITLLLGAFVPYTNAQITAGCYTNDENALYQGLPNANGSCSQYPNSVLISSGGTPGAPVNNGLSFTPLEPIPGQAGPIRDFCSLLSFLFKILIYLGGMLATLYLVLGGITYMVSDVVNKRSQARARIRAALIGLVILLSSYLILNTINPRLVQACNFVSPTTTGIVSQTPNPVSDPARACRTTGGTLVMYSNCTDIARLYPGKTCSPIGPNIYCVK